MRAVVWKSANTVVVENVDDPEIQEETDAILRSGGTGRSVRPREPRRRLRLLGNGTPPRRTGRTGARPLCGLQLPVGLTAALSAKIRGASEIYVVDNVPERLALVKQLCATPVDFAKGDPVAQILNLRKSHRDSVQNLRPGAGDKMPGVMCTIDAIGYEAKAHGSSSTSNTADQDPNELLANLIRVTNPPAGLLFVSIGS